MVCLFLFLWFVPPFTYALSLTLTAYNPAHHMTFALWVAVGGLCIMRLDYGFMDICVFLHILMLPNLVHMHWGETNPRATPYNPKPPFPYLPQIHCH